MYWLVEARGESLERRDQLTHPPYQKPELLATQANQLWSWDITKLRGPAKWTCYPVGNLGCLQPFRCWLDDRLSRKRPNCPSV